jgi:signal transduction histidine kinase
LQRKVSEQTRELRDAQSRLLAEARRAGMAQIATNVLHNVGNVLTSVNVSTHVLAERVRSSRAARLADVAHLLHGNEQDVQRFLSEDEKGRLLPGYLKELAQALAAERDELLGELGRLSASVDHIKNVVAMQQSYAAGANGVLEPVRLDELVDDALRIEEVSLTRHRVTVRRDYKDVPRVALDKTRVMQILVNLTENAIQAMETASERLLTVSVWADGAMVSVAVADSGCGISPDNTRKMFSHGFTTKPQGHGFGLHSCALAAREMGGSLSVHSDGPGRGATFTLQVPAVARERDKLNWPSESDQAPVGFPPSP